LWGEWGVKAAPMASREKLKPVPPPMDSEYHWRKLLNHLYGCGEDELFRWVRDVRAVVEEAERKRRRAA
jgi:hypothetical protein